MSVLDRHARGIESGPGRRTGRLAYRHGDHRVAGLPPLRRLGQHVHSVKGLDFAAL
jgi:hypothetical protein